MRGRSCIRVTLLHACDRDYTRHIIFHILLSAVSLNICMYKIQATQIKTDERKSSVGICMLDNSNQSHSKQQQSTNTKRTAIKSESDLSTMMALIFATPTGAIVDHGTTTKNVTIANQSRAVAMPHRSWRWSTQHERTGGFRRIQT